MQQSNFKNKLKGAMPVIGLFMTATGLVSVIYWNYLSNVNASAKEALSIVNVNRAEVTGVVGEIEGLKREINDIKDDTKYIRNRLDDVVIKNLIK